MVLKNKAMKHHQTPQLNTRAFLIGLLLGLIVIIGIIKETGL